jgi:hypothetical protein
MRTFYIFKINNGFNSLYNKRTSNVFKILNRINNLDIKETNKAINVYRKIIKPINKDRLNYLITNRHMNDFYYRLINNCHELKNNKEKSMMFINKTYIKIVCSNNVSTFFKDIYMIDKDLFVVDFKYKDYFYIEDFNSKISCLY